MQRRDFLAGCAAGLATQSLSEHALAKVGDGRPRLYHRATLVDGSGRPLRASEVPERQNLLFHYPYRATPVFLLNLGKPTRGGTELRTADGERYAWRGGVGAGRSIVAFSAICSHRLAYPTPEISFISFRDSPSPVDKRAQVIHCCAEHSQYDPAEGARVLAGPADQPLAAILLEHDAAKDTLTAVGTQGGEMFDEFFRKYQMRLMMEHGARAQEPAPDTVVVMPLAQYCRQQVRC